MPERAGELAATIEQGRVAAASLPEDKPPPAQPLEGKMRAAVATLLAVGACATAVGAHDAIEAEEIALRLIASLLFASGLLLLLGAIRVLRHRPNAYETASVAGLVGVLVGVLPLAAQLASHEAGLILGIWIVIAGASGWAARVFNDAAAGAGLDFWKKIPVLAALVPLGVVVSFAQFLYSSIYLPGKAPPSLTLSLELARAGTRNGRVVLHGAASIHNTSDTRVGIIGAAYKAWGAKVTPRRYRARALEPRAAKATIDGKPPALRYANEAEPTLVALGKALADGTYLDPDEQTVVPVTAYVPPERFDIIHLRLELAVARGNTLMLDFDCGKRRHHTAGAVKVTIPVTETSWLRQLIRSERFVIVEWGTTLERPLLAAAFTKDSSGIKKVDLDYDRALVGDYGVASSTADFDLPLSDASILSTRRRGTKPGAPAQLAPAQLATPRPVTPRPPCP